MGQAFFSAICPLGLESPIFPEKKNSFRDRALTLNFSLFLQSAVAKPFGKTFRPTTSGADLGVMAISKTVPGVGEDVKFGRDFRGLVFEVHRRQTFGDVGAVAITGCEKNGRHAWLNLEAARTSRIDEGLEVRPTALPLDGIGRVFVARVVFHGGIGSQFATRAALQRVLIRLLVTILLIKDACMRQVLGQTRSSTLHMVPWLA